MADPERPPAENDTDDPDETDEGDEAEEVRRQDPEAPALGAVDDGEGLTDLPEPQEPG